MRQQARALRWSCGAWLALAAGVAAAQATIYRCGPDGRSFSEKPCADGSGRTMSVDDSRSDTELTAAREVEQRQARAAESLARDNRRFERSLRPGGATSLSGPGTVEAEEKPVGKSGGKSRKRKGKASKSAEPDLFTAEEPGSERKKRPRD
ncbi:hypothetical protein [Methylibium rhizosphaerae]|uniref:hypothetical protein n=1 Tax=Methylibium rhizosphaerae TaxID=2570323 RepID=UPI00112EA69B|nr:hypothetical protein [Methylibium rhizosphaerae]